jgi:hypothetical protein
MSTSELIVAAIAGAVITGLFALIPIMLHASHSANSSPNPSITPGGQASSFAPESGSSSSMPPANSSSASSTEVPTFSPSSPAVDLSVPASYLGLWQGTLTSSSNTTPEPLDLTITGGRLGTEVGKSSYPTFGCTSNLILESSQQGQVVAEETANGQCDQDTIVLAQNGSQLDISIYGVGAISGSPEWSGTFVEVKSF